MALQHSFQGPQHIGLGQKLVSAAGTLKSIYDVGRGIYHVAKFAAPIISSLLTINLYVFSMMGSTISMTCC